VVGVGPFAAPACNRQRCNKGPSSVETAPRPGHSPLVTSTSSDVALDEGAASAADWLQAGDASKRPHRGFSQMARAPSTVRSIQTGACLSDQQPARRPA
jgi:hypothetical protein